ncbi:MAG: ferritin family protein [Thermoanaerobaculia bacterium]
MTRTLNEKNLDLRDALDLASLIEEEAKERYEELADQMELHHDAEVASFFHLMAKNETRHGAELAERRKRLFPGLPRRVDRSMLWDVEAPGYETVHAFMSLKEALEVALAAEVKAFHYFSEVLKIVPPGEVKTLFEELKVEEIHHQDLVKKEMAKLGPEEKFTTEDYADEPVGH